MRTPDRFLPTFSLPTFTPRDVRLQASSFKLQASNSIPTRQLPPVFLRLSSAVPAIPPRPPNAEVLRVRIYSHCTIAYKCLRFRMAGRGRNRGIDIRSTGLPQRVNRDLPYVPSRSRTMANTPTLDKRLTVNMNSCTWKALRALLSLPHIP